MTTPRPWQLDWKHPVWQCPSEQEESSTRISGHVLDHVSAAVLPQEIGQEHDDNSTISFVLTVTLIQTTQRHETDTGNVLLLEILKQQTRDVTDDPNQEEESVPTLERLQSSILQWPASVFMEEEEEQEQGSFALPFWRKKQSTGIVAVSLCRRKESSAEATAHADALDVLYLLSLGQRLSGTQQEWLERQTEPPQQHSNNHEPGDLILACLTSKGNVYIYSPWQLLNPTDQEKDEVEDSMASLLLGDQLLHSIQTCMLPLSQPLEKIKLSVPFLVKYPHKSMPVVETEEMILELSNEQEKLSAWDPAMWDSLLDKASLPWQTQSNVVTHCVAAMEYLCIAGRGQRKRKRHRSTGGGSRGGSLEDTASHRSWDEGSVASAPSTTRRRHHRQDTDNGGFVTFISLRTYREVRTVYLPFVPKRISPVYWGGMTFVMVLGSSRAVLIRTDASELSTVTSGKAPSVFCHEQKLERASERSSMIGPKQEQQVEIPIRRFQVLPIKLPNADMAVAPRMVGSSPFTTPPAIVFLLRSKSGGSVSLIQQTLKSVDLAPANETGKFAHYGNRVGQDQVAVVSTVHSMAHVAQIDFTHESEPWCNLGQGWCLVGVDNRVHFVCLEGSTSTLGAFVLHLPMELGGYERGLASNVLPIDPFEKEALVDAGLPMADHFGADDVNNLVELGGRFASSQSEDKSLSNIIVQALEDISSLSYREEVTVSTPPQSVHRRSSSFSRQEKFRRLLRHCSSWKQLEESRAAKSTYQRQLPITTVRLGTDPRDLYSLSLRRSSVQGGPAAPFQSVLSWLAIRKDYFTAASLALDLLRDAQSLRHLWSAYDRMDDENEMSMLESLLDGVVPLHRGDSDNKALQMTLTQLADMTVGCLVKGGVRMSSTLSHFVRKDRNYDPSRACLMLAAVTPNALSLAEEQGLVASGNDRLGSTTDLKQALWPVRSLLEVGTSRESLVTAVLLLNATIPDELRCRKRTDVLTSSSPSMSLCKALVSLIVASSEEATQLLLTLVDEQTRKPYWESLDHPTRRELSLLNVEGKFPLLRQLEVRTWAILALKTCIESEGSPTLDVFALYPNEWLISLCEACLLNAGCDVENLLSDSRMTVQDEEALPADDLREFKEEVRRLGQYLLPAPGSGGLDFDLFIPALLILETRGTKWNPTSQFSTCSILNSACNMAGRRNVEAPLFSMDGATLMRECVLAGNVQAGANLIGGRNGLILECCYVLIEEVGMTMEEAESFLLSHTIPSDGNETISNSTGEFKIGYSHRLLLWLLDEHVLSIRKYGDFDSTHSRGRVDPVFAARTTLRTWWRITRKVEQPDQANWWLIEWLGRELSLGENENNETEHQQSPRRLACAALARALFWSSEDSSSTEDSLACRLRVPNSFLLRLSLSCCGLVEALPAHVVKDSWRKMEGGRSLSPNTRPGTRSASSGNEQLPTQTNETLDESFESAVSSLVM